MADLCSSDRALRKEPEAVVRDRARLRVIVACEFFGVVRRAFRARGHDAWSCDILPAEDGSPFHFHGSIRDVPMAGWDLMIAHPPCTYLTNAGARWWPNRQQEQADALEFVRWLLDLPVPRIALENPPGRIGSQIRKADQYVHPWQFGHMETKTTGLWLKNLPKLVPTNDVRAEMMKLTLAQRSRVHWMPPGPDRWKERSRTFQGIADAMAAQWGSAASGCSHTARSDGQGCLACVTCGQPVEQGATPPAPAAPPGHWDEYAMHEARRLWNLPAMPKSQLVASLHCALIDAMRFAASPQPAATSE